MAGTALGSTIKHDSRGVVRIDAAVTVDASGDLTLGSIGKGFGRLVGVEVGYGTLDFGSCTFALKDGNGATLFSRDSLSDVSASELFGSTTTGDTTGGASEDLWTTGAVHGLVDNDQVIFTAIAGNGSGGPTVGVKYYVDQKSTTTFQLLDGLVGVGSVVNVGSTDATSSSWFKVGTAAVVGRRFHPTNVIVDTAGANVSAADTAPNVNRDIYVAGNIQLVVAEGGNLGAGTISVIIDETGLTDPAITV